MASSKKEYWAQGGWAAQGYRTTPGVPITAPGAEPDAVLEADTTEAEINQTGEEPEVISPTPSSFTGHHTPANRTTSAEYYPEQHALKLSFPASSPASGGSYMYQNVSADEWEAFQATTPGHWIEAVGRYKSYGRV